MYAPSLEKTVTFEGEPDIRQSSDRHRVHGLLQPFRRIGWVGLAAVHDINTGTRYAGENVLEFLAALGRFVPAEDSLARGDHTYRHRFATPGDGLEAARLLTDSAVHPYDSIAVDYRVERESEPRGPAVIGLAVVYGGHPNAYSSYARLAAEHVGNGDLRLRLAIGDVSCHGIPVPDDTFGFDNLAALGDMFGEYRGQRI